MLIKEEREKYLPADGQDPGGIREDKTRRQQGGNPRLSRPGAPAHPGPYFDEIGVSSPAAIIQDFDNLVLDEVQGIIDKVRRFRCAGQYLSGSRAGPYHPQVRSRRGLDLSISGQRLQTGKGITRIHALRGDSRQWSAQAGYKGAIAYGNFLLQSMKNKAFQKTMLAKTPDSYNDWWYEQPDPLHFTKKEG